jgi:hypothetical protein
MSRYREDRAELSNSYSGGPRPISLDHDHGRHVDDSEVVAHAELDRIDVVLESRDIRVD